LVETTEAKVTSVFAVIAPPSGVTVTACAVAVYAADATAELLSPPAVFKHPIAFTVADFVTLGFVEASVPSYLREPVAQVVPSVARHPAFVPSKR
jgi:hypothetical protein